MVTRREMLASLAASAAATALPSPVLSALEPRVTGHALRLPGGAVDWTAVRNLFPLRRDITHLASFLLVSHPKPVADAIATYRAKLDADPVWLEDAALTDKEGRPFTAVKQAMAGYIGGKPEELALTSNTTVALAMAVHGLKIRADQEFLATTHDHYSAHESIRFAAERIGFATRRVDMYDPRAAENATVDEMVARVAREIRPNTRGLLVTWVHSSTGVRAPVARIAQAVAHANRGRAAADRCVLIVDGVHGFANQDVDVATLGADLFASGCHKWLFAPRGTGFLWGKADVWSEMRPVVPNFDPDGFDSWPAWMGLAPRQPMRAAYASPGGFMAYEHILAIKAAVDLHREIGRAHIAARVAQLNAQVREGLSKLPNVTLHTPSDASINGGLSCFEVKGLQPSQVTAKLMEKRFRVSDSPYNPSYARICCGIMNNEPEVERVLAAVRVL